MIANLLCPLSDVQSEGFSRSLQQPTAFAAVDSINPDDTGRLKFHYVVVEVRRPAASLLRCTATT
jgi:hypothetical protein